MSNRKPSSRRRLRLRISHRDASLVVSQGSTTRSYKPFAQAFGVKSASAKAALIVTAVNCHIHMIKALQAIERTSRLPLNGNGARLRTRLTLIGRYASSALKAVQS